MSAALGLVKGSRLLRPLLQGRQGSLEGLLRVLGGAGTVRVATLKATHGEKYPYSAPFPYWKKKYNTLAAFLESTAWRFNENSKIIVVEGNVGVGKTEFAQSLAKEFDLKYFPPTLDSAVFFADNDWGYDSRKLDPLLPEGAKAYDLSRFLSDPHPERGTVGRLQLNWYECKFMDYALALKHLLSTGQGVVLVRSVYSDQVFVDAMRRMGYVTPQFVKYYADYRANSICDLLKPHMTIYLDAPISTLRERINARKDPREVGSKILSDKYLQTIADVYRDKFLPLMRKSGEVVEIDWKEKATEMDMDVIAEELQLCTLEAEDSEDTKFADWTRNDEEDYTKLRLMLDDREMLLGLFMAPLPWECPEVMFTQDDAAAYARIVKEHPIYKFAPGWAPTLGHRTALKF